MINILKKLKIGNTDIADDEENDESRLCSFIEEIYNNCKKLEIPPAIIPSWINNLLDFQSFINIDKNEEEEQYDDSIQTSYGEQKEQQQQQNLKEIDLSKINMELDLNQINNNVEKSNSSIQFPIISDVNFDQTIVDSSFSSEIKIPFVSQVSFFISQKKNEIEKLTVHQKTMEKNIKVLKEQEKKTSDNFRKILKKAEFVISNLKWFSKLEQSLQQNYFINIRKTFKVLRSL
jgi:hypothetical protein